MRVPPINRFNPATSVYSPKLKDRQGQDTGGNGAPGYESPQSKNPEKSPKNESSIEEESKVEESPPTAGRVDAALDEFRKLSKKGGSDLNIEVEGQGPGLKVVLKDTQGSLVRQMSGEEFVKLNQPQSNEKDPVRGKILDRKM